ncbi:MAG: aminotransferase class V-fold PLP-dependent enzyme [Phycisphaeraceae bacterium]|nr:aminotransferase class V-fold PLP-dependent enzyme [Phycisphaeraceae bacterium]
MFRTPGYGLADESLAVLMETSLQSPAEPSPLIPGRGAMTGSTGNPACMPNDDLSPDPRPDPGAYQAGWRIDPDLCFLNHGSYGSVPAAVHGAQVALRERVERDPVRFFKADLEGLMDESRRALARFLSCRPGDLAPVRNATVGLCTIFANRPWKPGDEVVVTDHEYSSGLHELERIAPRAGIRIVTAHVPFPIDSPDRAIEAVEGAITSRTRLVVVSHVTSCSSLVFPVGRIADLCRRRGVDVLIDGAHAPGQVPVDIASLDPAYYVGSLHKWVGAPRGASFVYVRGDLQEGFRTIALSSRARKIHENRSLFLRDFDYMGTDDYTPFLVVPDALDAGERLLAGGWPALMARNHALALEARAIVCAGVGLLPSCPDEMTGSMVSLPIPDAHPAHAGRPTRYDDPLQDALLDRHGVQAPIWRLWENPGVRLARLSAQAYNRRGQYAHFAKALAEELGRERRPVDSSILIHRSC